MGKSLITGYYGMKNYGDDLFSVLTFLALNKYKIVENCQVLSPVLNDEITLNHSCLPIFNHGYPYLNKYGTLVRTLNVLNSLRGEVDNIFFSGGSLYNSENFTTADIMYKKKNCKFHALGVSVGPYHSVNAEKKVIENLKKYTYISVRDKASYERVLSYNLDAKIVLASDLAGLGFDLIEKKEKVKNEIKKIGFSPCLVENNAEKTELYINQFYEKILSINSKEFEVVVLCLNENPINGDVDLCQKIHKRLLENNINSKLFYYSNLGVVGTWSMINNLDYYFTVRLHGAITAYLTNTQFYLFEYHEKCTEFLKYIGKYNDEKFDLYSDFKMNAELPIENYFNLSKKNIIEHPLYKG